MPRIDTQAFLELLQQKPDGELRVMGLQNGTFNLLYDLDGQSYIHSDRSGNVKEYRHIEQILEWLQRKSDRKSLRVDFKIWNSDK